MGGGDPSGIVIEGRWQMSAVPDTCLLGVIIIIWVLLYWYQHWLSRRREPRWAQVTVIRGNWFIICLIIDCHLFGSVERKRFWRWTGAWRYGEIDITISINQSINLLFKVKSHRRNGLRTLHIPFHIGWHHNYYDIIQCQFSLNRLSFGSEAWIQYSYI